MPLALNARRESGFWLKIPLTRYCDYMICIRNVLHDRYLIMRFSSAAIIDFNCDYHIISIVNRASAQQHLNFCKVQCSRGGQSVFFRSSRNSEDFEMLRERWKSKISILRKFICLEQTAKVFTPGIKIVVLDVESHLLCYLFFCTDGTSIIYKSHILI